MVRRSASFLLIAFFLSPSWAQQASGNPSQSVEASNAANSTKPTLPASAPDAPMPDLGSVPSPSDPTRSSAKRMLDRLKPLCLDALFHTCWAQPPEELPASASKADFEFARNMEVAKLYFKSKNYAGAASRFRDALEALPHNPEATFKLARSLEKLRKTDEARDMYQSYLKLQPKGQYAKEAVSALEHLSKQGKGH
jgi:tetratricopeptide (TPR) repeat protein